ncbi:MAG: hypothetical protein ACP5QX_07465, partial [Caldisericaceae bacterium]
KEIPKGWKTCSLRFAVIYYIGGGWGEEKKFKDSVEAYVIRGTDIPFIKDGNVSSVPLRYHKNSNYKVRQLKDKDIILEISGGSKGQPVGRVALINSLLLQQLNNHAICASFCKLIRLKDEFSPYYIYLLLNDIYYSENILRYQLQSTGISNFNFEFFLDDVKILLLPDKIKTKFDLILELLFNKISFNGNQARILSQIRDALLPKLMSGKIRVPLEEKDND